MEPQSNSFEHYLLSRWNNEKLVLSHPKFSIGRGINNSFVLEHLQVSRIHCILEQTNGSWYLTDQSSNGTLLNKGRIPPKTKNILRNGDIIKLTDEHEFVFVKINKSSLDDIDLSIIIEEAGVKFGNTDPHTTSNINKVDISADTNGVTTSIPNPNSKHISNVINEHTYCIVNDAIIVTMSKDNDPAIIEIECTNTGDTSSNVKSTAPEVNDIKQETACGSSTDNKEQLLVNKNTNSGMDALEEAENELQCIICTELFVKATTLNCSHSFCKTCIEEWRKKNKCCPICRTKITTANPTIVLDNFISKLIESSSTDVKEKREEIIKSREVSIPAKPSTTTIRTTRVLRSRVTPPIEISSEEEEDYSYDDEDFIDHDYDYTGLPGHYYGGYGRCYSCGEGGHWSNGCPYR